MPALKSEFQGYNVKMPCRSRGGHFCQDPSTGHVILFQRYRVTKLLGHPVQSRNLGKIFLGLTRRHIVSRDAGRELWHPAGLLRLLHLLRVHRHDGAGVGVAEHEVVDQLLPGWQFN